MDFWFNKQSFIASLMSIALILIAGNALGSQADASGEERAMGKVVEIIDGIVHIDLGRKEDITSGSFIEFLDPDDVEGERVYGEPLATGRVLRAGASRTSVQLPLNVHVPVGTIVRKSEERVEARVYQPHRPYAVHVFDGGVRPVWGPSGIGVLLDAGYGYRFRGPWAIDLRLSPVGLGWVRSRSVDGGISVASARGIASYDETWLQIGVGGGLSTRISPYGSPGLVDPSRVVPVIVHQGRLGYRDGVHVGFLYEAALLNPDIDGHSFAMSAQLPLSTRGTYTWLVGEISLSGAMVMTMQVGYRLLRTGTGGPGSFLLTPTLGITGLGTAVEGTCRSFEDVVACGEERSFVGVALGLSGEWRR